MSSTDKPTPHAAPQTAPTGVFSVGRQKVLRNGQHPRNSGPNEVKLRGNRRPAPMAQLAPAPRPSRSHSEAQPQPSHSQFERPGVSPLRPYAAFAGFPARSQIAVTGRSSTAWRLT